MANIARLSLIVLAAAALAACGGSSDKKSTAPSQCHVTGKQVSFPLLKRDQPYVVTVKTNFGTFDFTLDVRDSPCVTGSFVHLVRKKFFDGTIFHRIVPGFVIQGGDPTGTGTGGPGYTVRDTVPRAAAYVKRDVAMAKTSAEPAGTAGSQFFVVLANDVGLTPDYALLGVVRRGWDVVQRIGTFGNANEQPTRRVVIQKMTVSP